MADFGFREVADDEKTRLVGDVFRRVAPYYDRMNDLMSLGLHRLWKRAAVALGGVRPGMSVLDLAGGNGDCAALLSPLIAPDGDVIIADISIEMLTAGKLRGEKFGEKPSTKSADENLRGEKFGEQRASTETSDENLRGENSGDRQPSTKTSDESLDGEKNASQKYGGENSGEKPSTKSADENLRGEKFDTRQPSTETSDENLRGENSGDRQPSTKTSDKKYGGEKSGRNKPPFFIQCNGEQLPFADRSFDRVFIAFGLRNITHRRAALCEMHRVLRPGGQCLILEFSQPATRPVAAIHRLYLSRGLPCLGKIAFGDADSYRYLGESILRFPDKKTLSEMMKKANFGNIEIITFAAGAVAVHRARRLD